MHIVNSISALNERITFSPNQLLMIVTRAVVDEVSELNWYYRYIEKAIIRIRLRDRLLELSTS